MSRSAFPVSGGVTVKNPQGAVQFNDNGDLAGSSALCFNNANSTLTVQNLCITGTQSGGGGGTITGGTNGLGVSGANICLGGALTSDTLIETNGYETNYCGYGSGYFLKGPYAFNFSADTSTIIGGSYSQYGLSLPVSGLIVTGSTSQNATFGVGGPVLKPTTTTSGNFQITATGLICGEQFNETGGTLSCISVQTTSSCIVTCCFNAGTNAYGRISTNPTGAEIVGRCQPAGGASTGLGQISANGTTTFMRQNCGSTGKWLLLNCSNACGIRVCDTTAGIGLQYDADYSASGSTNPRWIPDNAYVTGLTSGATVTPIGGDGSVQFNSAGALSGTTGFTVNGTQVEITGSIKLDDGNQADGYILTSDASGVGSWQPTNNIKELTTNSDLDNVVQTRFKGSIGNISVDTFDEISTYTYRVKTDGTASFTSIVGTGTTADTNLQSWIDANVSSSTLWVLEVTALYDTGKSGESALLFNYQ